MGGDTGSSLMKMNFLLNNNHSNDGSLAEQAQQQQPTVSTSSASRFSINSMINDYNNATLPHIQPTGALSQVRGLPLLDRASSPSQQPVLARKPSINSLTNDNDVDIKGNETPSITTKFSSTSNSSSVNNSPVVGRPSLVHLVSPPQVPAATAQQQQQYQQSSSPNFPLQRNYNTSLTSPIALRPSNILNNDSSNPSIASFSARKTGSIASLLSDNSQTVKTSPRPLTSSINFEQSLSPERKSISHELKQLDELEKTTPEKPKKYEVPPIWAQDWIPTMVRNKLGGSNSGVQNSGYNKVEEERGRTAYNPNLDVSITKVIPYEDLTRKVSQWLYSHLQEIKDQTVGEAANGGNLLHNIELEIKFGRIWSKELDSRIDIPVSTETIITDQINYAFRPGLENSMFVTLEDFIMKLNAKNNAETFKTLKSDTVDYFYHGIRRGDKPYDLRVSQDKDTNRTIDQIEKRRIGDLFIHSPSNILDFRISLSLEVPIVDIPKSIAKGDANMKRRKIRTSYITSACKNKIDLTKTYTFHNVADNKPEQNHEVEVELETEWLLETFHNLLHTPDNQTYEDTIKVLLDNCRILNRAVSK